MGAARRRRPVKKDRGERSGERGAAASAPPSPPPAGSRSTLETVACAAAVRWAVAGWFVFQSFFFVRVGEKPTTFLAGPNVTVHVVPDFLPTELALRWRDAMASEWDSMGFDPAVVVPGNDGPWKYTTNNDGTFSGHGNAKSRGNHLIQERREVAGKMRDGFAYSKWELDHGHALTKEMQRYFESEGTMKRIGEAVGADFQGRLSDFFVTNYASGDFLTRHDDGFSGSWAFVLSMARGEWRPEGRGGEPGQGGDLLFECPFDPSALLPGERHPSATPDRPRAPTGAWWCERLSPCFNTAVFFRTRPVGPYHEVLPVTEEGGGRRFGATGWYMEVGDDMDKGEAAELQKMRAK